MIKDGSIDPKYSMRWGSESGFTIFKTSNGAAIPDDEPLILFRARDRLALPMLRAYRQLSIDDGCTDYRLEGIDNRIAAFEAFQREHASAMKQPGVTKGGLTEEEARHASEPVGKAVVRPEIPNPVKLTFRVADMARRDAGTITDASGREVQAVPLHKIFDNDLERTLWMAIKCRHLTSQYFHHQIRDVAARIRVSPPKNPHELHRRIEHITGRHVDDQTQGTPDRFCEELFRYVLSVLDGGSMKLEYEEPA